MSPGSERLKLLMCVSLSPAPGAVVTPIWDKSEAKDMSAYDSTPYKQPLARFSQLMLDNGRSGLTPEHVGRWAALSHWRAQSAFHPALAAQLTSCWYWQPPLRQCGVSVGRPPTYDAVNAGLHVHVLACRQTLCLTSHIRKLYRSVLLQYHWLCHWPHPLRDHHRDVNSCKFEKEDLFKTL